jgi:hypothetical protein
MSSMPRLLAASISTMSTSEPSSAARQRSQVPHGSLAGPFSQFRALAKIRAVVVLPVPRGQQKR